MATLDASIWLLLKQHADPEVSHDRFTFVYRPNEQLDFLWLYLYFATQADHLEVVKSIVDRKCSFMKDIGHVLDKPTLAICLNEAVRKSNKNMIRVFLDHHPDLCTTVGRFYIADNRFNLVYSPIELAVHQENIDVLEVLMEYYGGQVIGADRQMPLHLASKYTSPMSMTLLLRNEESLSGINQRDAEGWTPILLAAMHHPACIPRLLQHGADVTARTEKAGNALQILANWSIRSRQSLPSDDDPCPTLARTRTLMQTSNDVVYIADHFVSIARAMVENGIDVNSDDPDAPLRTFAKNIERRLADVRGNKKVYDIFRECMSYLAEISGQAARDGALLDLCHLVNFVGTQLRRSHDYDNLLAYIDLLPFIRDLIVDLLYHGAHADIRLKGETGDKKIRTFQYILPSHQCTLSLKQLIATAFTNQPESDRFNSPIDIALLAITNMYSLQIEESELHTQAMLTVKDIIAVLTKSGSRCLQTIHFFVCLSIDTKRIGPMLQDYIDCLSQRQHQRFIKGMLDCIASLPPDQSPHFTHVKHELVDCQNRLYSLKHLIRRDIHALLGGGQHAEHIDQLPLPQSLKSYIQCWD